MTVNVNVTSSEGRAARRAVDSASPDSELWLPNPESAQ
jgi:hypothetical protein